MPRIVKRPREDEIDSQTAQTASAAQVDNDEPEDPLIAIRKRAIRQNPTLTTSAKASLKIALVRDVLSSSSSTSSSSSSSNVDNSAIQWWTPVFTHQLFPLEKVFGYKNPLVRIVYSDPDLRISVQGNADSVKSDVTIPNPSMNGKLLRVSADNLHTCLEKALPPAFPAYLVDAQIAAHNGSPPLRTPMYYPEDALPLQKASSSTNSSSSSTFEWKPFGKRIHTFQVQSKSANGHLRSFSIYQWKISESAATRAYHERASTLAVHLIETASAIDVTDQRWTCFGLYEELPSSQFSFAGYATVFRFISPLRKLPKGGDGVRRAECVRLSQLIVLPPFQRLGLGMKLLSAVQGLADEVDAFEVTIESPCEEMASLRDAHDIRRAFTIAIGVEGKKLFGMSTSPWRLSVDDSERFLQKLEQQQETTGEWINEELLEPLRSSLKITLQQARRCFEALCLSRINFFGDGKSTKANLSIQRSYRLLQKKRFYLKGADVRALPNVEDRKAVLEDRYRLLEASYLGALSPLVDPESLQPLFNRQDVLSSQTTWYQRRSEIEAENERDEEDEE
jgi:GNAT superfamily N-acetyltransferase